MQREYPVRPLVAVGAVVVDDSRVLLVRRAQDPSKGLWSVPGGLIELGETAEEAARREVKEETGIDVQIERLLDVTDNIVRDDKGKIRFHYVLIDFLARPMTRTAESRSDVSDVKWVLLDDISTYSLTEGARNLILKIEVTEDRLN